MKDNSTASFRALAAMPAAAQAPGEDGLAWIHIAPKGEFPGTVEIPAGAVVPGLAKPVEHDMEVDAVTVLDAAALERIVQAHADETLIDYEHFSMDRDKATAASGWGSGLRYCANREDGLELGTRWAEPAKQQIRDQVYRYVSPVFSGFVKYENDAFRFYPTALTGAGLTNRPKLKTLRPVTINREHNPTTTTTTDQPTMNYKSALLKMLGLPETASDEEIEMALPPAPPAEEIAQKNREITGLKAQLKTLADAAIEADLERFAPVIEDKEDARKLLSLNRDLGVKLYSQLLAKQEQAAANVTPIYQKNRATPPDGAKHFADAAAAEDRKAAAASAFVATVKNREKCGFEQAWQIAKAEKPELF